MKISKYNCRKILGGFIFQKLVQTELTGVDETVLPKTETEAGFS